jgi:hypothetical protein
MPLPEPVTDGKHLPVCLNGDRLEFTQYTRVVIRNNGRWVERHEFGGASWDGASIPRILWSIAGHPSSHNGGGPATGMIASVSPPSARRIA